MIAGLDAGNYLEQRLNVVFQEATGSGKSHLLCALVKSACRARYRAVYVRMPDLAERVTVASNKPGGVPKLVREYATYNLFRDRRMARPTSPTNHSNDSSWSLWSSGTTPSATAFAHAAGDQGMAPTARRRHHRRRDSRPHRAQRDLD
ncbi:ATP-binding protein [Bifidobacterium breve]|uniref:ATP-binding protein n=1 Tax=Bifidobacterium breve TaxID=1685 RepID=UPI001E565859|nr:ATP-binding protein [Bifidobacterium breve]